MAADRAYLDHNASAPLLAAAREAMVAALDAANPSSVHAEGRAARRLVEDARRDVAALVSAKPEHVVFTSGATEAAATLLTPDWRMGRAALRMARLYVSEADHPCLLNGGRFVPEIEGFISVAPQPNTYDFSFLAPCPSSGLIIHGDADKVAPAKDVQGLVDKLHTQKGITITQKTLPGANHFFSNDAELLIEECADYLDRRLAGELADPRPKRLR